MRRSFLKPQLKTCPYYKIIMFFNKVAAVETHSFVSALRFADGAVFLKVISRLSKQTFSMKALLLQEQITYVLFHWSYILNACFYN